MNKNIKGSLLYILLRNLLRKSSRYFAAQMLNRLYALLMRYPEENWGWDSLTRNPNITLSIILQNLDLPWDFKVLRDRNDFCAEFARKFFQIDAPNFALQNSKSEKYKRLRKKTEQYYESWENLKKTGEIGRKYKPKNLSYNTNISLKNALEFPHLDWDWRLIFRHSSLRGDTAQEIYDFAITRPYLLSHFIYIPLSIEFIRKNIHEFSKEMWYAIAQNKTVTWEMIGKNKDLPWDYEYLCLHGKDVPLELLEEFKDKVDWFYGSDISIITWEFVKNNPSLNWNWDMLIFQPWMTTDIIVENIAKIDPNRYFICEKIPIEHMLKESNRERRTCLRPDISVEIYEKHKDIMYGLDNNLGLPFDYVKNLKESSSYNLWQRPNIKCYDVSEVKRIAQMRKEAREYSVNFMKKERFSGGRIMDINFGGGLMGNDSIENFGPWISQNKFDVEKRAASTILRNWLIYKRKRNLKSISKEISLLPPSYIHKNFVGGEEYREAFTRFTASVV